MPSVSAQAWVSTATKALPLTKAVKIGALPATTPLHIVVGLKMRNASEVQPLLKRMSTPGDSLYGTSLTVAQFVSTFAPTTSQVNTVTSYLTGQGFKNVEVEGNQLLVQADGTAAQAEAAFHTSLSSFTQNGKTVFANVADAQVPTSLSGTVAAVLGLSNVAAISVPAPPSTNNLLSGYSPQDYQIAYDAAYPAETDKGAQKLSTGSNTSIAIFAEGDLTQVVKDLRIFETVNKLPQVAVTIVNAGIASTDTSGQDEWDLDSQSSTGIAQQVKHLYFYVSTSLTDSDIAVSFSKFVSQNLAKAGNASFGECEFFPYIDGAMLVDDQLFAEAALQGQTVFASTGDNGSACPVAPTNGVPLSGPPFVLYPAASPYVVAAGGTDLLTNADFTYDIETAAALGGGGISQFETAPFWQSGVVPSAAAGDRGLPDVAMCADPNTCAANVYVDGAVEGVGGTSLASPLSMGSWARIESAHGNKLGFAGPLIYKLASGLGPAGTITGFHDIVIGSNGLYAATPGWDYTTGLGSFDIFQVNKAIPSN